LFSFALFIGCSPIRSENPSPTKPYVISSPQTPFTTLPPEAVLKTYHVSGWVVYSIFSDSKKSTEKILLTNLDTNETIQLTNSGSNNAPKWSSDGNQILFLSWTEKNHYDIYIMDKDGSNQKPVLSTFANERMASLSPDSKKIVFISDKDGNDEIYTFNLETQIISRLTNSLVNESFPQWSSDGNQIAFISSKDTTGRLQVFTMKANGTNIKQVTAYNLDNFDKNPIWCPDDSCLIFTRLAGPAKLMFLDLKTMEVTPLLKDIFQANSDTKIDEGQPSQSPVRGYITFSINGVFYAMNMKNREIYPLNIEALDLSLYP